MQPSRSPQDLDRPIEFEHFFIRKGRPMKYSSAFVITSGGFGTLDDPFETITLIKSEGDR